MMALPKIDGNARTVLRTIQEHGVMAGGEVLRLARLETADQLVEAVRPLLSAGLVNASGEINDPRAILSAYFNIRPSVLPLVRFVLAQI